MITHEIVRWKAKPRLKGGSHEHRLEIFNRTLDNVLKHGAFTMGEEYYVQGIPERGVLIGIQEDIKFAGWDGLKVKIMELWFSETNVLDVFHPSDLKRAK